MGVPLEGVGVGGGAALGPVKDKQIKDFHFLPNCSLVLAGNTEDGALGEQRRIMEHPEKRIKQRNAKCW